MMKTWLLPVYSDSLMRIEQLVPYETNKSIDDISSHTCLHTGDTTRIRQIVTQDQDLFVLFPTSADQHYFFGSKSVPAHNCLFIDSLNNKIDKWAMVERFPGLWDFFRGDTFRQTTISYPIVFWHAPVGEHQQIIESINNSFASQLNQQRIQDWRYDLQEEILPHWDQEEWPLLHRLVEATLRSVNDRANEISHSVATLLNINNIDLKIDRRRMLKQIIKEELLQDTLIGKLLSAMKSIQDTRVHATEFSIVSCLVVCFDKILVDTIKQHLGK
jgi:hypothetical protein